MSMLTHLSGTPTRKKPKVIRSYVDPPSNLKINGPKIITFYTSKGGVGKTTLCQNFVDILHKDNRLHCYQINKILLIDLDSQMSLTNVCLKSNEFDSHIREQEKVLLAISAGININSSINNAYEYNSKDILSMMKKMDSAFQWKEILNGLYRYKGEDEMRIDLIKGALDLSIFNSDCESHRRNNSNLGYYSKLINLLVEIKKKYDLIVIDVNPEMSSLNYCILEISDKIIMPVTSDSHAMTSMTIIKRLFLNKSKYFDGKMLGFVLMKVKQQKLKLTRNVEEMKRLIEDKITSLEMKLPYLGYIEYFHGLNEKVHSLGKSIVDHAFNCMVDTDISVNDAKKRLLQAVLREIQQIAVEILIRIWN